MVKYMNNGSSGFQQYMAAKEGEKKKGFGSFWVWLVVFAAVWFIASTWLLPKPVKTVEVKSNAIVAEDLSRVPTSELNSDLISGKIQGLRVSDISLKKYKHAQGVDEPVRLLTGKDEFVEVGFLANGTTAPAADTAWKDLYPEGVLRKMTWRNADGIDFTRSITVENYTITIFDEIKNNGNRDVSFVPYARVVSSAAQKSQAGVAAGAVAFANGGIEREDWKRMEKKSFAYETQTGFVGFESQYWQTIVSTNAADQSIRMKHRDDGKFQADTSAASVQIGAGKSLNVSTKIYAGPKTRGDLKSAATDIAGIDQTIDYGWFWFLSRPFLMALTWLFAFVGNYGIAIILLTIGLRILMWPLTKKSVTSMASMQKMQPEMQRIQKQYADDKAKLQAEMLKLYQSNKTSPMGGCLPMLLQIPIFFGLYKALLISVEMRHCGFLWLTDLSAPDPTSIFNLFGLLPYSVPSWLVIGALPIIMGLTMWWQQHLQSGANAAAAADKTNPMAQSMKFMKWMPILFVFMFAWMPAGLVLYWTVSNLFGIGQMWVIKKQKA